MKQKIDKPQEKIKAKTWFSEEISKIDTFHKKRKTTQNKQKEIKCKDK